MKLPGQGQYANTWQFGDELWEMKFVKKIPENALGIADPSNNTIYIKQKQTRYEVLSTAIHEWIHCAEFSYGFELNHDDVEKLEVAIVRFLTDNLPALTKLFENR